MANLQDTLNDISHQLRMYGINSFQCWEEPSKTLNATFGMENGKYKSCTYGVQSVHLLGYCIAVEYNKGDWEKTYHCYVGNGGQHKSTIENVYYQATPQEEKGIIDFWYQLIEERKKVIEDAKKNPPLEDFIDMCLEVANKCLENTDYHARKTIGRAQSMGNIDMHAIVIDNKYEKDWAYAQKGYIVISKNKFGEFGGEVKVPGYGGYGISLSLEDYQDTIKRAIDWIL